MKIPYSVILDKRYTGTERGENNTKTTGDRERFQPEPLSVPLKQNRKDKEHTCDRLVEQPGQKFIIRRTILEGRLHRLHDVDVEVSTGDWTEPALIDVDIKVTPY